MALIKCPECGKDVSDQAEKCPNCGHPISETSLHESAATEEPPMKGNGKKILIGVIVAVVVIIIAAIAYYVVTADSRAYAEAKELYAAGNYQDAYTMFTELGGYEDSATMADQCEYELTVDRRFIRGFSASLVARWAASDAEEPYGEDPDLYERWSQMEIIAISPYADQEFNDPHLAELLDKYLVYLGQAVEATMYYISDYSTYSEMWDDAYSGRATVIKELVNDYDLTVPEQYQTYLDEMIDAANVAAAEQAVRDASHAIADATVIEATTDEYGLTTYQATLENTSEYTYDYFNVQIKVTDASETIVGNGFCAQLSNWGPGERAIVDAYISGVDSIEGLTLEFSPQYNTGNYYE